MRPLDLQEFVPAGEGPWPAVLYLHEVSGVKEAFAADARALAACGYLVWLPDLYSGGLSAREYVCILHGFCAALAFLRNSPSGPHYAEIAALLDRLGADPRCNGRVGVLGMCLTGGFALQAARRPDVGAAVVYHHVTGLQGGGLPWSADLPEGMRVQGHHDVADWRSPPWAWDVLSRRLGPRLERWTYTGVGHCFRGLGAHRRLLESRQSWRRTREFFDRHLKGPG